MRAVRFPDRCSDSDDCALARQFYITEEASPLFLRGILQPNILQYSVSQPERCATEGC
jgi:hypothetical protein